MGATATLARTGTHTPAAIATATPTGTVTATPTLANSATPTPTPTVIQATMTASVSNPAGQTTPETTRTVVGTRPAVGTTSPTVSPTALPPTGTMRMYLCPLAVLLVFAVGVLVLSVVLPRLQERNQDVVGVEATMQRGDGGRGVSVADTVFAPEEPHSDGDRLPDEVLFGLEAVGSTETERTVSAPEEVG